MLEVKSINNEMLKPLLILETKTGCAMAGSPCKHCSVEAYANSNNKEKANFFKAISEFIEISKRKGHVVIKNGAGALDEDELRLIKQCVEGSLEVSITTEAVFISKKFKEGISALLEKFPGKINYTVSLDGETKEVYGLIRQEKHFEKACDFIQEQVQKGVFVSTNFVVHKGNVNHIAKYADFVVNTLGVQRINFIQLGLVGNAIKYQLEIANPKDFFHQIIKVYESGNSKERNAIESTFVKAIDNLTNPNKHFGCNGCVAGSKNFAFIKSNGNIYPCSSMESPEYLAGNLKTTSLRKVMNGNSYKKARKAALQLEGKYPIINMCPGRKTPIEKDIELAEEIQNYLQNKEVRFELNPIKEISMCFNHSF